MPTIALSSVSKAFGTGAPAVDDLTLEVPDGSFTCLLGPSGCGKTTTLRMIAGLEHPTSGSIAVGDRVLDSVELGIFVPPERRDMGLVFQSYALWPHLNVARNVEFGLRIKKVPGPERERRVDAALRMMQIEWARKRYPAELSGGQQQRVSLARMLAVNPDVLLLDEPLSNLDARLRLEMRTELKRMHDETRHTIVFVTHDQLEAMTMATHVAVMNEGVLQQMAPPMEVYNRPANAFVAQFVGSPPMNLIDLGAGTPVAERLASYLARLAPELTDRVATVGIRPEAVRLAARPGDWHVPARVVAVLPTGSTWIVSLTTGPTGPAGPVGPSGPSDGAEPATDGTELFLVSTEPVAATGGQQVDCAVAATDMHAFDQAGRRVTEWDQVVATALVDAGRWES